LAIEHHLITSDNLRSFNKEGLREAIAEHFNLGNDEQSNSTFWHLLSA
jgi:hypothetical protein